MARKSILQALHHWFSLIVRRIDQLELVFTTACMIAIVVINGAEIFSRYFLDHSLFFVYEITILLANWMYFIGFCLVYNRGRDIEIEFFTNFLSKKIQRYLQLVTKTAVFIFLMIIGYFTFDLLVIQSRHSTEGLNIPNHYFSMPIFVGTISMLLSHIRDTIDLYLSHPEKAGGIH